MRLKSTDWDWARAERDTECAARVCVAALAYKERSLTMVWKLKKTKTTDDDFVTEDSSVDKIVSGADDDFDFETGIGPSEAVIDAAESSDTGGTDLYSQRISAVDEAIAALTASKKQVDNSSAPPSADDDDWSLDAFAPYKPPQHGNAGDTGDNGSGIATTGLEGLLKNESAEEIDFTKGASADAIDAQSANNPKTVNLDDDIELRNSASVTEDTEWQLMPAASAGDGAETTLTDVSIATSDAQPQADDNRTLTHVSLSEPSRPVPTASLTGAPEAARLEVQLGQFSAKYDLADGETVIGRPDPVSGTAPQISIEWDDAISRRHASVIVRDGKYCVIDLGSKNGTLLNGNPIPAQVPIPLTDGDLIGVGERAQITFVQS